MRNEKLAYESNAEDLVIVKKRYIPEEDTLLHPLGLYSMFSKKFKFSD